jgi:hypothetical protein
MRDFTERETKRDPADVRKENEGHAVEEQRLIRINLLDIKDEYFVTTKEEIELDEFLAFKFAVDNKLTIGGKSPKNWYKFLGKFNQKMQEYLNEESKRAGR